jgi:hypothetical protein
MKGNQQRITLLKLTSFWFFEKGKRIQEYFFYYYYY